MWLKDRINKLLVREIKSRDGEVVFRRWRLLKTPWFQVFVHAIYAADRDYFLHDHPWNFVSCVLKGGYREDYHNESDREPNWWNVSLIQGIRERKPGSISYTHGWGQYHRIRKLLNGTCWTIVIASPSFRKWGYLTPKGWISNGLYREIKNNGEMPQFLGGVWF